jgi:hypothetical protein
MASLVTEAARLNSPVKQSRAALLAEPIPWRDRQLGPENLKTLLLARLPENPSGKDVEALFRELQLKDAGRQGDMVQAQVRARPWYWPTRAVWTVTALVDGNDDVVSFSVQYRSGI